MTRGAAEFVTPLTFQTLSGNPVVHDLWGDQSPGFDLPQGAARKVGGKVGHVDVAEAADVLVIAPATANLIARLVHGEAPDALAAGARDRGAEVTLVAGPASIDPPERVKRVGVVTAAEMEKAMVEASRSAEVVLMAAAVADFRPRRVSRRKIKRDGSLELELE